jgi:hypothetical protein
MNGLIKFSLNNWYAVVASVRRTAAAQVSWRTLSVRLLEVDSWGAGAAQAA